MATAFAASCLKNMSVLFPEIVDIFMPVVLKALDDSSINCVSNFNFKNTYSYSHTFLT
jgi:hypothetical protein